MTRYAYFVDGKQYGADRLQFILDGHGQGCAVDKLYEYLVDSVVEVSNDLADPELAVLESGGQF